MKSFDLPKVNYKKEGVMVLECKNIKKSYKKKCVVDSLSFTVEEGEVFALLGANGAGKTTTIKMILNLTRSDEGEIIKRNNILIGYSPDTPYFPQFLSGKEILEYYGKLQRISHRQLQNQISLLLELVGLEEDNVKVKFYSKGMLQRLALAQALLSEPELLILDEPTAGLDALGRIEIMNIIHNLKEKGKTIIINSHILNDIERVCDRGIILHKGKLLREWTKIESDGQSLEEIFIKTIGGR
jgi:ABC-2 type transport system ATP-binding protein